jgi:hypothetical protein|nr:MAG TPA: hypothetical protein [Inoviridae sp.]
MKLVDSDILVTYQVKKGDIRAISAGVVEGRPYGPSVRITCSQTFEVENEKTQFTNIVKQEIVFKISCPSDITAGDVARFFQKKFDDKALVSFLGTPADSKGVVTIVDPYENFLLNKVDKSDKAVKGA